MATPADLASEAAGVPGPRAKRQCALRPGPRVVGPSARDQDAPDVVSGLKKPSETGTTLPPLYCTMRIVGWTICGAAGGADFLDSAPPMKTFSPSTFFMKSR